MTSLWTWLDTSADTADHRAGLVVICLACLFLVAVVLVWVAELGGEPDPRNEVYDQELDSEQWRAWEEQVGS